MYKLIEVHSHKLTRTDLMLKVPCGFCGQIFGKSGLALKYGILAHNGLTDSDFRGVVCVVLYNTSDKSYQVLFVERIAQIVITKAEQIKFVEGSEFSK